MTTFLGLDAFQWLSGIMVFGTLVVMIDAGIGHYRHAFSYRLQYAPLVVGTALIAAALAGLCVPRAQWVPSALRIAGWTAGAAGLIGCSYHLYFGIIRKPGGRRWLLHYLMYGAPLLAPLGLSAMGLLAVLTAAGLDGIADVFGLPLAGALRVFVAIMLVGTVAQVAVLHYRGAFNNVLMYLPLSIPVLLIGAGLWAAVAATPAARVTLAAASWLTLLTGFVGYGMHLRGLDRQMGGLYIPIGNLLIGPPQAAPGFFITLAAVGLVTVYLLR